MAPGEIAIWFCIVFAADMAASFVFSLLANRKKPDIACDACGQVRFLEQSPDNKWLCEECMAAYLLEHGEDLEVEE